MEQTLHPKRCVIRTAKDLALAKSCVPAEWSQQLNEYRENSSNAQNSLQDCQTPEKEAKKVKRKGRNICRLCHLQGIAHFLLHRLQKELRSANYCSFVALL